MKRPASIALLRDKAGATAVEFALIATPLLLIALGIMEFGRVFWIEESLGATSSVVARCVGLTLPSCSASSAYSATVTTSYAQTTALQWGLSLAASNVSVTTATSCLGQTGSTGFVQVSISYSYTSPIGVLIPSLASRTLTGHACFPMGSL